MSRSGVAQTRARRAIAACAAIALALAFAACGDDEEETTVDLPAAADEICLDVAEQLVAARGDSAPAESAKDAAEQLEAQLAIRLEGLQRLQALRPPAELVAGWDQYMALAEDRIDAQDAALTAAQDEDDKAFAEAQKRFERLSDESREVGSQIGLEACAEALPPAGQEDVLAAVEKLLTSRDSKKVCRELVTEYFAETEYGSVEKCESDRGFPNAVSLELLDVGGVAATSAFVDVEVVDFFGNTKQQRIDLVFDDDSETWKVDARQALAVPEEPDEGSAQEKGESGAAAGEGTTTPEGESPPEQDTTTTTTPGDTAGSADSP